MTEQAAVNRKYSPYDAAPLAVCSLKVNGKGCAFGNLGRAQQTELQKQGGGAEIQGVGRSKDCRAEG